MKLANFASGARPGLGLVQGDRIVDLSDLASSSGHGAPPTTVDDVMRDPDGMLTRLREGAAEAHPRTELAVGDVTMHPAMLRPGKMLSSGNNYPNTGPQDGGPHPPVGFVRVATSLSGCHSDIVLPPGLDEVYYECELAVVISKPAFRVDEVEALSCVGGYAIGVDIGSLALIRKERAGGGAPMVAKNFPSFGPLGPWLTTADEVSDPMDLSIYSTINGEVRHDSSTSQMLRSVGELVVWYSQLGLEPGDVIFTGSPAATVPGGRALLAPGDELVCSIGDLGTMTHRVVER